MLDTLLKDLVLPIVSGLTIILIDRFLIRYIRRIRDKPKSQSKQTESFELDFVNSKSIRSSRSFLVEPWARYSILVVSIYSILVFVRNAYPIIINSSLWSYLNLKQTYPQFITPDDIELNKLFIGWFGVFIGLLLPLILVKVWKQFEVLEKNFDKEADSLKVFAENIMLLPRNLNKEKAKLLSISQAYTQYIQDHYIDEEITGDDSKKVGDDIINRLRIELSAFFNSKKDLTNLAPLISQLLSQLNVIVDVRGDRISSSQQRLFSGLRPVAVSASLVWLIPFYFLDFELGLYGDGLVLAVTALIVFVLHTIEDLNEPFHKKWKLDASCWKKLEDEIQTLLSTLI
ncbi:MAG: hypothetical protein U0X93_12320 [Anaerolineales bacterium]